MNVVVTGATSFIGAPLTKNLLDRGHRVFAVVRPGSANLKRLPKDCPNLTVIERNLEDLEQIGSKIDVVCPWFFHLGWDGAGSDNRMKAPVQQKNAADSVKALLGAKSLGCRRFLFSGSQAEYGISAKAMKENMDCHPVSEYGKAKVDFLTQALALTKQWREEGCSMEYLHARIFSVYGPGDHPWSLVESCVRRFLAGEYISLGECTQQWNFLYIDDLIRALIRLMECEEAVSGIYNVAGEEKETRPLREYVRMIYETCGFHGSYSYGRRPPNAEGPANLIPSTEKIRSATGWRPETDFKEGIRQLMERKFAAGRP